MLTWEEVMEVEDTGDRHEFGRMCSNITVFRQGRALILLLPNGDFRTLSSGFTNGGFMDSPQAVVNITGMGGSLEGDCMRKGLETYDEVNLAYARKLGLDPDRTVFQGTAANMDNAVIVNGMTGGGIKVSAAITAGIRHNGGRSGDPACFDESCAVYGEDSGTIIILLSIDAHLSDPAMVEAMLIATEAKSCVIQELQAKSLYSNGIATGSGTDQVTVISNLSADTRMSDISRDSELSRTIAECVSQCLREAFDRQSGMNTTSQWDPLMLMSRYNLDQIREEIHFPATMAELLSALEEIRKDGYTTALVSGILNVADDVRNGHISQEDGLAVAKRFCSDVVLRPREDPVEKLRIERAETITELMSYVAALRLMDTVKARRSQNGQ